MQLTIFGIPVRGVELDQRTGCAHYRGELDIVAVKFSCCGVYYACFYCHAQEAGHPARIWPRAEFDEKAVLCGACGSELSVFQYLTCGAVCPQCAAQFNPRCNLHYHLYFETAAVTG